MFAGQVDDHDASRIRASAQSEPLDSLPSKGCRLGMAWKARLGGCASCPQAGGIGPQPGSIWTEVIAHVAAMSAGNRRDVAPGPTCQERMSSSSDDSDSPMADG